MSFDFPFENVTNMYPHILGIEQFSHPVLPVWNQQLLVLNQQNTLQRRKEHRKTTTFPESVLSMDVDIWGWLDTGLELSFPNPLLR